MCGKELGRQSAAAEQWTNCQLFKFGIDRIKITLYNKEVASVTYIRLEN